ncbi:MAG: alpha/beta hydrolase [Calditrichia bacterium]
MRFWSFLFFVLFFNGCGVFSHTASFAIVQPHRCSDEESRKYFPQGIHPEEYNLAHQEFSITVRDTLELKGWHVQTSLNSSRGTMIIVHGMGSCKEHQVGLAEVFALKGFNSILFDLPAHGKSGGKYTTYGYYERHDIVELIDSLDVRYNLPKPLGIFGNSLGGAIALQVMAEDSRIKCGVIESTFATLDEVVYDYLNDAFPMATRGMISSALEKAGKLANFEPDSVRPEESAKGIGQPVLIIHGTEDAHISVAYGRRIYDNLLSEEKEMYEIAGGTHDNLWQVGGEPYKQKFLGFLIDKMRLQEAVSLQE